MHSTWNAIREKMKYLLVVKSRPLNKNGDRHLKRTKGIKINSDGLRGYEWIRHVVGKTIRQGKWTL